MIIYNEQINNGLFCSVVRFMAIVFSLLLFGFSAEHKAEADIASRNEAADEITEGFKIKARYVILAEPVTFKTVKGETAKTGEIVEFRVVSSSPIPARGYDPVIVVGKHRVTDYRYVKQNELLFVEYQPDALQDGSDVFFQWGIRPVKQQRWKLSFIYELKKVERVNVQQLKELYKQQ